MVKRTQKIDELLSYKDKNVIKVVTGFRRSGKSTLFDLYIDKIKSLGVSDKNIIKINLENPEYSFNNYKELYDYVIASINKKGKNYVFIDEIQIVTDFQKAIDGLYINKNIDLYVTGSNAKLLSGELATLLSGRYIEIKMLPYSFNEFLDAYGEKEPTKKIFDIYFENGGMPGNVEFIKDNLTYKYLDGVFSTVVYKDIMLRTKITDKILMDSIIRFLISNIGSFTNIKKISDTLSSNGYKTNNHIVEKYISMFLDSYLFYKADAFDLDGKELLKRNYKYYIVDTGFINYIMGKKAFKNYGHILENLVYIELKRRYEKVYVGRSENKEIDFVVDNRGEIIYYQVAMKTDDEEVLNRELKPLKSMKDNYKKYLLTLDDTPDTEIDGIERLNIVNWIANQH